MKGINALCLFCFCVLPAGCMNGGLQPAVLNAEATEHSEDIARIEVAISELLNGTPVNISNSAFRDNSELILERNTQNQLGRSYEMPLHFRLWLAGGRCRIEHVESGEMRTLEGISCSALTP